MRKSSIIPVAVAAFAAGLAVIPGVSATNSASAAAAGDPITNFDVLKECLEATEAKVCTLGGDIKDWSGKVDIAASADITLDLANHTLQSEAITGDVVSSESGSYLLIQNGGSLTIKGDGGKIVNSAIGTHPSTIFVYGSSSADAPSRLTVENGVTIEGVTPVNVQPNAGGNNATIDIAGHLLNNVDTDFADAALNVFGEIDSAGVKINLSGTAESTVGAGLFQAGLAETTISGTVSGLSGIVIKSGDLILNDATVTATGEPADGKSESGFEPTGAAIQIDSNSDYPGNINIDLNDGTTLESEKGDAIQEYGDGTAQQLKTLDLNGDVTLTAGPDRKVLNVDAASIGDDADSYTVTIDGKDTTDDGTSAKDQLTAATDTFTTVITPDATPDPNGSGSTGSGSGSNGSNGSNSGNNGNTGNGSDNGNSGNTGNGNNNANPGDTNPGGSANNGGSNGGTLTPADPSSDAVNNPNTADPVALYATVALLSLLGLSLTSLIAQRQSRR